MTFRKILIATFLLLCQPAFALGNAVETRPDSILLPATENGMVSFKAWCDDECDDQIHNKRARLTPNTKFRMDGRAVKFAEFRRGYAAMRAGEDSYALVSYDTETNTVLEIEISR